MAQDTKPQAPQAPAPPSGAAFGSLLAALQAVPEVPLSDLGASLLAAHIVVDLGRTKAATMKASEAHAYALDFRRRLPMAWPAIRMANAMQLCKTLAMAGIRLVERQEYDALMQEILNRPKQPGFENLMREMQGPTKAA